MQSSLPQLDRLAGCGRRKFEMPGALRVAAATLLWLGASVLAQQRLHMNDVMRPLKVAFSAPITSLRLLEENRAPELILQSSEGYMRPLFAIVNSENGAFIRTLPVSESRASKWDATVGPGQTLSFIFSIPESASIWLSYLNTEPNSQTRVTRQYPKGYFGAPHFAKGGNDLAITSVATMDRVRRPVLFSRGADGGYGEFRTLPSSAQGNLTDARLLHVSNGYVLFRRVLTGDSENREAGIVSYSVLDSDFHESKPSRVCFNGLAVLDFDVDAAGGRIALLATTPHGYVLPTKGDATHFEEILADELSSPSILVSGDKIHIAALEFAGTPKARVFVGEASVQDNTFLP